MVLNSHRVTGAAGIRPNQGTPFVLAQEVRRVGYQEIASLDIPAFLSIYKDLYSRGSWVHSPHLNGKIHASGGGPPKNHRKNILRDAFLRLWNWSI